MAIMDFLNRQFIDVIEWVDDSRDTLSYRYPDDDKQIKNEAQLIVRESQIAQFVYVGQFADTLGPGRHTLKTETSRSWATCWAGSTNSRRRSRPTSTTSSPESSAATSGAPPTR